MQAILQQYLVSKSYYIYLLSTLIAKIDTQPLGGRWKDSEGQEALGRTGLESTHIGSL